MLMKKQEIIRAEKKAGGKGHILIEHLITPAEMKDKCQMFAKVTLEPHCSLGYHQHVGNNETYHIIEGTGLYNDNGKEITVQSGDTTFCPDGEYHGIENTGDSNLVFMALIITE
ncbi:cupin domain-containing protein [Pectinatus brassicae]|uniref:Quercetin dioxygenase-like cupin family protein n=1 Tax=Pectinatus brassicae TaxID=862415 RepID=A0A840ULX1_9FIRM|nr:cupin domain-containing protein [Pectinatus brassicae]MBB5336787.1 quercetin dioxygenase-like cupin family protein [Pectinatus brassicae]